MEFFTRFSRPRFPGLVCNSDSKAQQHFKRDCDVNYIVNNYVKRGLLVPFVNSKLPEYGDVPSVSFFEAATYLASVSQNFSSLPSSVRDRFRNDPGRLLEFLENPSNKSEAISLGLMAADPVLIQKDMFDEKKDVVVSKVVDKESTT